MSRIAAFVFAFLLAGCGTRVPLVKGKQVALAEERLQRSGLKASIRRQQTSSAPRGEVIAQTPEAGMVVKGHSNVSLVVAEGPTLKGTFTLIDSDISRSASGCAGTGGFSDVKQGMQVVVKNQKGEILALGELDSDNYSGEHANVVCEFPFSVRDIPRAEFYEIEVGRRGGLKYSLDDLRKAGWAVRFSLGSS
jgi:hypothetical protein